MSTAERLRTRMTALIARLGVDVTITHEGDATTRRAIVQVMAANDRTGAFRTSEITNWLAPAYLVTIAGAGTPVTVGDPVTLPSDYPTPGDLTVLKIERTDVGQASGDDSACVKTLLFCAATSSSGDSLDEGSVPEW